MMHNEQKVLDSEHISLPLDEKTRLEAEFNKLWYSMRRYYVDEFFLRQVKAFDVHIPVLDLGGHKFNKRGVFDIEHYDFTVYYANLNAKKGADFLSDASQIATQSSCFGTVICAELMEHVPNPVIVLQDVMRVLKPGGKLIITVPYLYQIHGDPYDYGRYTDYYWHENLTNLGFENIQIEKQGLFWSVLADMLRVKIHRRKINQGRFSNILEYVAIRLKHIARQRDQLTSNHDLNRSFTTGFGITCYKPQSKS